MQEEVNGMTYRSEEGLAGAYVGSDLTAGFGSHTLRPARATPSVPPQPASFGRVVGASAAMRKLYPLCRRLADSSLPLVIGGETGTGKELLAEAIHEQGERKDGPFVVLDCTSIPSTLAEATLFGHEKGAFTGATEARRGSFEEADGGTLLLDEIGDLDLELQAKLLRALERSEVTRVGSTKRIQVNVRFIAATRRDLREMVRQGKFRDDLYYRLAVTHIELPPLRQRPDDLSRLAKTFWERMAKPGERPSEALLQAFARHDWPGNVRELHNAVARCVALGESAWLDDGMRRDPQVVGSSELVNEASGEAPSEEEVRGMFEAILDLDLPLPKARRRVVAEFEQRYVKRALARTGGNVTRAAQDSGVGSRYFRLIRARAPKLDK